MRHSFAPSLAKPNTAMMNHTLEQRLKRIQQSRNYLALKDNKVGLEKESLRVSKQGQIAQSPHPKHFGSALTNPYITTDYSEALMEFITPPYADVRDALQFLYDAQKFVYEHLTDEILWATSMPCILTGGENIPIAQYGSSNAGQMKTVYRRGLGLRYGRAMQVIAGVHFNFSVATSFWPEYQINEGSNDNLQDFISNQYLGMIRNLQRFGWLVPYLFGASPAVCKSFLGGQKTHLQSLDATTYYHPYATSLRMGDIGYQNNKEKDRGFKTSYNSLEGYIQSLTQAIETPHPEYEQLGILKDGVYQQLNGNILQIENEYYSTIRPKQIPLFTEKPTLALKRRGIQYVELRSLDVNAFHPLGITESQLRFLEAFLLFCLFHDSPPILEQEQLEIDENALLSAHHGRDPALMLHQNNGKISPTQWASEICDGMRGVCELLDSSNQHQQYIDSLNAHIALVKDPEQTPSALMLAEMRDTGEGFYHFAQRMSHIHHRFFRTLPLMEDKFQFFSNVAQQSLAQQTALEARDEVDFAAYLKRYFEQQ